MNQQHDREDDTKTQPLADLPMSGEQAEELNAGAGTLGGSGKVIVHDISI